MKKFRFSMESVLSYRQQVQDAIQIEYAEAMARVHEAEKKLHMLIRRYREFNEEYCQRKAEGISVADAFGYDIALEAQSREIQKQEQILKLCRNAAERKRDELIQARRDSATIENLRSKKLDQYNKAVQKSEEQMIDELVSAARFAAQSAEAAASAS